MTERKKRREDRREGWGNGGKIESLRKTIGVREGYYFVGTVVPYSPTEVKINKSKDTTSDTDLLTKSD